MPQNIEKYAQLPETIRQQVEEEIKRIGVYIDTVTPAAQKNLGVQSKVKALQLYNRVGPENFTKVFKAFMQEMIQQRINLSEAAHDIESASDNTEQVRLVDNKRKALIKARREGPGA